MGWGNSQRRRGAAPHHYKLPSPAPRSLRQAGVAYGGGNPIGEDDEYTRARVRVFSLDGAPLRETALALTPKGREDDTIVVQIPEPRPGSTTDEVAEYYARIRRRLEHGIHVPERGLFHLKGAADDPHAPIGDEVALIRATRQRYKIPIYNLTTGQPLPDVTGEGTVTVSFDNSAFHSLFPDTELAIVRISKAPDRAVGIQR